MTLDGARGNEELRARVSALEMEKQALEQEHRAIASRLVEMERQNAHLGSLFVACHQLLGCIDREDVLTTIQEIVINLIGSEEVGIFEREGDKLTLAACRGLEQNVYRSVPIDSGKIGRAVTSGRAWLAGEGGGPAETPLESGMTACVPMRLDGRVTGVIAVFRLLPQKSGFNRVDLELFDLLGVQAATALYCASLRAERSAATGQSA
jgi:GAF domain-containing protein